VARSLTTLFLPDAVVTAARLLLAVSPAKQAPPQERDQYGDQDRPTTDYQTNGLQKIIHDFSPNRQATGR
jgi:hypothetical protein